jgi:hypothetical protein
VTTKLLRLRVALIVGGLFLLPSLALAADYVSDTATALDHVSVYVVPPDSDTTARLQASLRDSDGIALAVLPADAATGTTASALATAISERLGNKKVIGIAVGNIVAAAGPALPSGVATDLMRRADSVSNDPITALVTFVQNVHIWQADHPGQKPSVPVPDNGPNWPLIVIGIVLALGLLAVLTIMAYLVRDEGGTSQTKPTYKVPGELHDLTEHLAREGWNIEDIELRSAIRKLCGDIEIFFKWNKNDKQRVTKFFHERLVEVNGIVDTYIRVQQHPQYHNNPAAVMKLGKDAIMDFGDYVVQEIKKGNDSDIGSFKMNAHTLEAYREMRFPQDMQVN